MAQLPKDNPVRRNSRVGPLLLPAEGRKGRTPVWPLPGKPPAAEARLWRDLWRTPQAVAWERLGWTRIVARYVRTVLVAETLDKDAMSEARQLEDRLGLTPRAMRSLLWKIVDDDLAEKRAEKTAADKKTRDVRQRVRAVE